jgi:hypothetical protein
MLSFSTGIRKLADLVYFSFPEETHDSVTVVFTLLMNKLLNLLQNIALVWTFFLILW